MQSDDLKKDKPHSCMPAVIVIMLTAMVAAMLGALYNVEIPSGNRDFATFMFGQVFTLWGASITYWVGTTRSSAEKDRANKKPLV